MKAKYYFLYSDSEICYEKSYFIDYMDGKEIEVYEAIPEKIDGIFWCKEQMFCGDNSEETCGKICPDYKPRNGKSGCCKHYITTLYTHGNKIILKQKS